MAIETKIQKQRSGNLAQLPILLAGELGYALDAKRLFIGNTSELQDGNGTKTDFTFGVDLDDISSSAYKIKVDSVVKTDGVDYTVDNFTIAFVTAPPIGTGNVSLEYNSEIHLFEPDVGLDVPGFVAITSASGAMPVAFDGTRYDNADIRYSLRNVAGHIRKGVLSIAVNATNNTHTISDTYTNNATTSGSLLDHVFTGTMSGGLFTLQYATNDTANADFAWLTDNFKATL